MPAKDDIGAIDLQPFIDAGRDKVREAMARDETPGAAAAFIRGEEVVWSECFGVTDAAGGRPIDPHTLFSVQSTSKSFTAVAVMIAVQRGRLDLDRPIIEYLPDFTVNSRHETNPQKLMTLRLLLSHLAGFTHDAPVGSNFRPEFPSFEAHVESISRTWLRYPVGARYAYGNLGFDLAGLILAKAFSAPFDEVLRDLIFDPLGMTETTATPAVYVAAENRAIGHEPGAETVPVVIPMLASSGVYSNAADMARYAVFHLGRGRVGGRTLLESRLWEEMHSFPAHGYQYGLGAMRSSLDLERAKIDILHHNGGGFGFRANFRYCPDQGLAWVLLSNGQRRGIPSNVFDGVILPPVLKHAYGEPKPPQPPAAPQVSLGSEVLNRLAGTYAFGAVSLVLRREGEALILTVGANGKPNRLAFVGPDAAWVAEGPLRALGFGLRFHPGQALAGPWLELGGDGFDYNGGEDDPPGTVGEQYDAFLGDYVSDKWGAVIPVVSLSKSNGHLYVSGLRATEYEPGLLFTVAGEALDLRGEIAEFRNIPLNRALPTSSAAAR